MYIVIIDYDHGAKLGRWQVNLTDGARVWDRQRFDDPRRALGRVEHHQHAGHTVICEAARADLAVAAFYRMLETTEQYVHAMAARLPALAAVVAADATPDLPPAA